MVNSQGLTNGCSGPRNELLDANNVMPEINGENNIVMSPPVQ